MDGLNSFFDSVSSVLVDPHKSSRSSLGKAFAWTTAIIAGVFTLGAAQLLSSAWREYRNNTNSPNETEKIISSIFNKIFGVIIQKKEKTDFVRIVSDYSFIEALIEQYKDVINSEETFKSEKIAIFLREELNSGLDRINNLQKELVKLTESFNSMLEQSEVDVNQLEKYHNLINNCRTLIENYDQLLAVLDEKSPPAQLEPLKTSPTVTTTTTPTPLPNPVPLAQNPLPIKGIQNLGNSCYVNAALQPLLAINQFKHLIPDDIEQKVGESKKHFEERKMILYHFKEVIELYQNQDVDPSKLGKAVGELRRAIFLSEIGQSVFMGESEKAQLDSGDFFNLVLSISGLDFNLETVKKYPLKGGGEKVLKDKLPQGYLTLKTSGSIQDKISSFGSTHHEKLSEGNEFMIDGVPHVDVTETNKIVGDPPEVLVIGVDSQKGYQVDLKKDKIINGKKLFKEGVKEKEAQYELVGFAQNIRRHWTSVVARNGKWNYCNDASISTINEMDELFKIQHITLSIKK